ncbi:unnamed protein product [Lactuca virosa]|uniref:Uncharacterized protein n=1 Tax=Lactuca virosa TaxID=75947 RepID=A0AAU9MC79_9ASTR|nr:unnamed protein product [Lactuca virosa]
MYLVFQLQFLSDWLFWDEFICCCILSLNSINTVLSPLEEYAPIIFKHDTLAHVISLDMMSGKVLTGRSCKPSAVLMFMLYDRTLFI